MSTQNQILCITCINCDDEIPKNGLCKCGFQAKFIHKFMRGMHEDKFNVNSIRSLIEKGANPNTYNFRVKGKNYSAVTYVLGFSTNIELIRYFISKQQMSQNILNFITDNIFMAVYFDNENLVKFLLENTMIDNINKKCLLKIKTQVKYTPLHYAALKDKFAIARLILNSNLKLEYLEICLGIFISKQQYSLAKNILDKKINPNFIAITSILTSPENNSPLTYAVKKGDVFAIKLLTEYGADPTFNVNGTTALQLAFSSKKFEIVMILLGSIVSNIFRNDTSPATPFPGRAPQGSAESANFWKALPRFDARENFCKKFFLYYAIDFNDCDFVKFLVSPEQNIVFDELNNEGYTPLLYALKREDIDIEIVKILSSSYDVNQKNPINKLTWRPVLLAIDSNNLDAVKDLLNKGAKIDLVTLSNNIKWTPILYAVYKGSLPIVEELMNRGVDINKFIREVRSPFNYSIQVLCDDFENRFSIFKFFLDNKDKYKIDINLVDVFGMTPLKWAIECRKDNVIKLLLESNAIVDQSVLGLATEANSSQEIIQRITDKMPKNDDANSKKRKRLASLSIGTGSSGAGPVHSLVTPAASDRSSFLTGSAQTSPGGTLLTTSVTTSTTTVKTTTTMSVLSEDPDEAARILVSLSEISGGSNEEKELKKVKLDISSVIDLTQDD
jgi:ankyrin repeat protein